MIKLPLSVILVYLAVLFGAVFCVLLWWPFIFLWLSFWAFSLAIATAMSEKEKAE